MSHFYGVLQGSRGEATRCGNKGSGLEVRAASWEGSVRTMLWYDEDTACDMARVELQPWYGRGATKLLYQGPVSGAPVMTDEQAISASSPRHTEAELDALIETIRKS